MFSTFILLFSSLLHGAQLNSVDDSKHGNEQLYFESTASIGCLGNHTLKGKLKLKNNIHDIINNSEASKKSV